MSAIEISDELLRNFHLFWGNFPSPVMLIYKDRTIVALNKSAQEMGIPEGMRCIDLNAGDSCKRCQANQALKEQSAKRLVSYYGATGKVLDSYWIPLTGEDGLYLHFGIDITEFAAERLFPNSCKEGAGCSSCAEK